MATESAAREEIVQHLDAAYRFALSLTGSEEAAAEVAQEASLRAMEILSRPASGAGEVRTMLMRQVAGAARSRWRSERRRTERERRAAAEREGGASTPASEAERLESAERVRLAVAGLDETLRAPVHLHYLEGLTAREVGEVLEISEKAVERRVERALEELRATLGRAGFALAPAAMVGALRTAPGLKAPAGLAGRVTEALSTFKPAGAGVAAAKGGVLVKIGLGIAAAGLMAGGALWAVGGRSGEPAKTPEKAPAAATGAKAKFDIPVWHPDARWKLNAQAYAGEANLIAPQLDGPRHEVMWGGHRKNMELRAGTNGGGSYVFMGYDANGERFHPVTTGAAGYFDGPFPVARLYIDDYHGGHERADSPDGRFHYMLDSCGKMRALDFAEQRVTTLPGNGSAVTCGESGKVYLVEGRGAASFTVLSPGPEWKVLENGPLQGQRKMNGLGSAVVVDEKQLRLYATTYGTSDWYVWYWDLKDGSLHGVLPNCTGKPGARKQGEAGPFDGTVVYNHGEICWGPDDPDKRFIYMTRVDTSVLFRLDLQKKLLGVFNVKEGRFVEEGSGEGKSSYSTAPVWCEDGSFQAGIPWYMEAPHYRFFRRVK